MDVPGWAWGATATAVLALLAVDFVVSVRRPHVPSIREATAWVGVYVTLAGLFAVGLLVTQGGRYAGEFLAGYLTEYSLSVDNLFVFVIIMTSFAVPRIYQQRVLLFGIALALVLRAGFIALGAAALEAFSFTFYVFGAFLVYTGVQLARKHGEEPDLEKNPLLRFVERTIPSTRDYHGAAVFTRVGGRRLATPMFIVFVAIGTTDLLFALDSIPAIFGLTQEPYLVFTANAFALMGLRQLYFLLDGLLDRLVYLSYGLALILVFIGGKLVLEAAHETWPAVPHVSILASLGVIIGTLVLTTVASLTVGARRHHAREEVLHHREGDELGHVREDGPDTEAVPPEALHADEVLAAEPTPSGGWPR